MLLNQRYKFKELSLQCINLHANLTLAPAAHGKWLARMVSPLPEAASPCQGYTQEGLSTLGNLIKVVRSNHNKQLPSHTDRSVTEFYEIIWIRSNLPSI